MGTSMSAFAGSSWLDTLPQMVAAHNWAKAITALRDLDYQLSKEELEALNK